MSGRVSRSTLGGRGRQNSRGRQRGGRFDGRAQIFSTNGRSALLRRPNYQDFQIGGQISGLPRLWFRDSRGNIISPHKVREFIEEIKKYTLREYSRYLHNIFELENAGYGEPLEPERPDDTDSIFEMEIWKLEQRQYASDLKKLEDDQIKLFGVIISQMSTESIDVVRQTATGAQAITTRDPLELVQSIITTHMTSGKIDNNENYYEAEETYHNIKMGQFESLDSYRKRFEAIVATLIEAANRAEIPDQVPTEFLQVQRFVKNLNDNYSHYADCFNRRMIPIPETIQAAMIAIVNHGAGSIYVSRAPGRGVFNTFRSGRADRGRGRGTSRASADRPCNICGSPSHWKNQCPQNDKKDNQILVKNAIDNLKDLNQNNPKNA